MPMEEASLLAKSPPRARRTQAERSEVMRTRLLEAAIESLATEGYPGSTLSSIVRRAGVSRGAQVHHYPSKQALFLDAASFLVQGIYTSLGRVALSIADEDDRLRALVEAAWTQLFSAPVYRAYCELVLASHHDADLAVALRDVSTRAWQLFEPAIDHYFVRVSGSTEDPKALFMQLRWSLGGLAMESALLEDEVLVRRQLELLTRQLALHVRARKDVRGAPKKIER
jgi:AcrR family transcriptional regulator